jgi:hypothetical protein
MKQVASRAYYQFHTGFLLRLFFHPEDAGLIICFILVPYSPHASTLKLEPTCSSEMSVERTIRSYIEEDKILHSHRCENHKSYIMLNLIYECKLTSF